MELAPASVRPTRPTPPGPWTLGLAAVIALAVLGALQFQAELPRPTPWLALAGALGLAAWSLQGARARPVVRAAQAALAALAWAAAVLAWGSVLAQQRLADALPPAWEGRPLWLDARVSALPQQLEGQGGQTLLRLTLQPLAEAEDAAPGVADAADAADPVRVPLPGRVSVWFEPDGRTAAPRAGERWRLQVRLRRVHALQNPGLPDGELWLLERGIGAQGSVLAQGGNRRLEPARWWSLQAAREGLRERLADWVREPRTQAVLAGLLLGDQAALSSQDWALLRDTGVVHLFSISGLHITGFAWLAVQGLSLLWRRFPCLCARWPAAHAARLGGLMLATGYALLAGWGVPAQRTVALLWMVGLLHASGRLWPWPLALLLCALPIALADPWALVQPGFWLSFVAVALLMQHGAPLDAAGQGAGRAWRSLRALLRTQAVATLGLAPLLVLFFGQLSMVGVLANLVAVPLVTLLLTPLTLAGLLLPWLWTWAAAGVQALFQLLQALAAWPWAVWSLPTAPPAVQALALLGLLLAALRLPRLLRAGGLLLLAPLFLWTPERPPAGAFRLRVFDVGQGSAVWVQTAGHDLLYDSGPRWGPGGGQDAAARVVLPSLSAAGVRRLDAVLLSHGDADHAGGWDSLRARPPAGLPSLPIGRSLAPPDPRLRGHAPCEAGQGWTWDGVRFELLHPPPGTPPRTGNENGCVLRVSAAGPRGGSVLLAADIGRAQELALLPGLEPVDLLLLAHHGSASSSAPEFLAALQPQLAFAQAGYRSRHGHPALAVQTRLRLLGIPLLSSASCGALDWHSSEPPSAAGCWRERQRRYWHQRLAPVGGAPAEAVEGPPAAP